MALIFRLAGRRLIQPNAACMAFARTVTIKSQPYVPKEQTGTHDDRNMKIGREMSPHLSIYAPQMTSMFSISHRITGCIVAGYTGLIALGAVVLSSPVSTYVDSLSGVGFFPLFLLKFILAFPLTYHFCNGIRHLIWDTGNLLFMNEIYNSAYVVIGLALSSAILLAVK